MDAKASKQCEGCVELAAKVAELEKQLVAIQDQLAKANKNLATSSKPPSSDITNPPPKRGKPGRPRKPKIGGHPGHKRHERKSFVDEQAIRFVAIHRRMTQGTRSETGPSWFERICTVVVTCEQQGRSVLKFLTESVAQFLHGEPAPSLVPSMCDSS